MVAKLWGICGAIRFYIYINNGFFHTNPDLSDIGLDEKRQLLHDAQMHCVLNPKREPINERSNLTGLNNKW